MSVRAKPMQIFCKLIGVAPYSFDPGSSTRKFKVSRLGIVYSIFIAALLTGFGIFNYTTIRTNLTSGSQITVCAQWLQFYINNGFSVLIIIVNSLQQSKIIKVFIKHDAICLLFAGPPFLSLCLNIQQAFNMLFDPRDHPHKITDHGEFKKDIFYGTTIVVLVISLHLLTILTSYFDNEKSIDYYWFSYGILFLLNTSVVFQFLYAVVKVGIKFRALNVRLEDCISEQTMVTVSYGKTVDMINLEVNKIADEHSELIDQTNLLISAFSYQILLSFVAALAISVTGFYLICKRIIQYTVNASTFFNDDLGEKHYDWWCLTCYPLLHSILLGSIISVCHCTTNQTTLLDRTLPRIQRIVQLSESSIISGFCHQLSLQRISFNVFHLFTINPSIICSIISTVLTYLIILVQFEISQDIAKTSQADVFNSVAEY